MTQRNTPDTMAWYRKEAASERNAWQGLCLKLCRTARNIDAVYPTAVSAAAATPRVNRVYDLDSVGRGMVAYFDDPNDDNPYGHIVTVSGRDDRGNLLTWTNDVKGPGYVSLVNANVFPKAWGDRFLFAATWLNGVELDMGIKPKPVKPLAGGGAAVLDAIEQIEKGLDRVNDAIKYHTRKENTRLVNALKRDREEMRVARRALKDTYDKFN